METKVIMKNREGLRVDTLVDVASDSRGLVFVAHGLHGTKDQAHIKMIAQAFFEKGYTVVRWDATHSTGESEGDMADATVTGYFHDFEDVVKWASCQPWYREPFIVSGHSTGGLCAILYSQENPKKVFALAPLATSVSGELDRQVLIDREPKRMEQWEKNSVIEWASPARPQLMKRLRWGCLADSEQYDALKGASALHLPILLAVGGNDSTTPLLHQQLFFDVVPATAKELHVIPNAPHTFVKTAHLEELKRIVAGWVDTLHEKL